MKGGPSLQTIRTGGIVSYLLVHSLQVDHPAFPSCRYLQEAPEGCVAISKASSKAAFSVPERRQEELHHLQV